MFTQHNPFVADIEKFNAQQAKHLSRTAAVSSRIRISILFDGADANSATAARVGNNDGDPGVVHQ